jgi:biotin operon repressor
MSADSTREQVAALMDKDKSAAEIAEALGKTKATVYVHIRNIKQERGEPVQSKRGRPPKAKTEGDEKPPVAKGKTRPAPGSTAKTSEPQAAKSAPASSNGHDPARFPKIAAAVQAELSEARSRVTVLEKMAESLA